MTSPGGLYNGLTYEEVMNGHSKIRNKGIENIFSQMGLVETSEKQRKADFNDTQQKLIRHGSPKNGYWEIVDE